PLSPVRQNRYDGSTLNPTIPPRMPAIFRGQAMLTVLGKPRRCCDGYSRRELLQAGALSLFGSLLAPPVSTLRAANPRLSGGRATSVVLLDLFGGPSHVDTFDPKPLAPAEIRGTFRTIATSLPGLRICEHLPRLA